MSQIVTVAISTPPTTSPLVAAAREFNRKKKERDSSMAKLSECSYLVDNDYDYLRNDEEWVERMKYRALNDYEVMQLRKLMSDLKTATMQQVNDLFGIGPLKFYFEKGDFAYVNRASTPLPPNASLTTATGLPYTASQDKFQVKAAFVATIIRHLILKDESSEVAEQDRQTFLSKYPFLGAQVGTTIELTWLNRFERSLRYLKRYVPAERNKILYLTVGNHLEGSTLYTTYITGGQNRPETDRRVKIFDYLCQVQPRKRAKRNPDGANNSSNSNNPNLTLSSNNPGNPHLHPLLKREGSTTDLEEKMNAADINKEGAGTGGGLEIKKPKRQYTKRAKLSPDIPSSLFYQTHNHSQNLLGFKNSHIPLTLEETAAGNTLTLFQNMFSRQSSTSNESDNSNKTATTASSSSMSEEQAGGSGIGIGIPYELSVLIAAVETQIKEEDLQIEEDDDPEGEEEGEEEEEQIYSRHAYQLSPAKRSLSSNSYNYSHSYQNSAGKNMASSRVSSSSSLLSQTSSSLVNQ